MNRTIPAAALTAAASLWPTALADSPLLYGNPQYQMGRAPNMVLLEDLDGDGDLDVATPNRHSDSISVRLNHGDGSYGPEIELILEAVDDGGVASTPWDVAAADVGGDAGLDLVAACVDDHSIWVMINTGPGTYDVQGPYPAGTSPASVALGDLDGDGDADAVVTNGSTDEFTVLLNDGNGAFAIDFSTEVTNAPGSARLADFDLDGDLDLALIVVSDVSPSGLPGRLRVFYNEGYTAPGDANDGGGPGDGWVGFNGDTTTELDVLPAHVIVADIDGAGGPDLVACSRGPFVNPPQGRFSILINQDGLFPFDVRYAVNSEPLEVAHGDFDGDGINDLACANFVNEDLVSVLPGLASGGFGPPQEFNTNELPVACAAGDLDGDGDDDLAVTGIGGEFVSFLLGLENEIFRPDAVVPTGDAPTAVVVEDFDGDAVLDVATVNVNAGDVSMHLGNGDGTFAPHVNYPASQGVHMTSADVDGDGDLDVVLANQGPQTVSILLNDGTGALGPETSIGFGAWVYGVTAADLDGDGDADLAATAVVQAGNQRRIAVLLNDGTGSFVLDNLYPVGSFNPRELVAGDFDGDGDFDLACANAFTPGTVAVILNNGDATFGPSTHYPPADNPWGIAAGDLDGDLDLDLVVTETREERISVLHGNGDGTFAPAVHYPNLPGPQRVALHDLDGDGDLDAAVTCRQNNSLDTNVFYAVAMLPNNGDGTFADAVPYGTAIGPSGLDTGDLNGDGAPDIVVGVNSEDVLSIFIGLCVPEAPCPSDLDGSGDVGFGDILQVIGAWGPCGPDCPQDLSGNGSVDFADILVVIGAWGPC
ncbi:MAG: VCBS repeat-containing protein [Planctomycetes bacterium]|nr:VCBS repeat-containing protein [Planctomycetota bacterium]